MNLGHPVLEATRSWRRSLSRPLSEGLPQGRTVNVQFIFVKQQPSERGQENSSNCRSNNNTTYDSNNKSSSNNNNKKQNVVLTS